MSGLRMPRLDKLAHRLTDEPFVDIDVKYEVSLHIETCLARKPTYVLGLCSYCSVAAMSRQTRTALSHRCATLGSSFPNADGGWGRRVGTVHFRDALSCRCANTTDHGSSFCRRYACMYRLHTWLNRSASPGRHSARLSRVGADSCRTCTSCCYWPS